MSAGDTARMNCQKAKDESIQLLVRSNLDGFRKLR